MNNTEIKPRRGRPRTFDRDEALAKAQALFHARGYDALSVADLTQALGINPPSFYAAFGSKLELYDEALRRYEKYEGLDVETALAPGTPLAEGVAKLLRYAADAYATGDAHGCMVIEGARGTADPEAGGRARARMASSHAFIRDRVAVLDSEHADLAADYIMTSLAGLSASSRNGMSVMRLRVMAEIAAQGLSAYISQTG
ncbi:TetR/AcrR family transcriptional regulator [Neorhizobium sp. NCHU2750]|uniref:TetR/AcrR family transcriptional regulator n=1 Tax=Neorhizobium sp. NCHU2750 TaxID=1825976 RepID=UPI000E7638E0|nr:TetR family transcriptional regulator [Neorhizobium sp. NCHU2750]